MALRDDWNKGRYLWGKCSIGGKVFFVVSFILSCTSVASLAGEIFQFRGFILTIIEFYRIAIDKAVDVLNSYSHLAVKFSTAEMFVLNLLLAASYLKTLNVFFMPTLTRYALIVIFVMFVTYLDYQDWSLEDAPRPENLPYYFYAVLLASLSISGFLMPGKTKESYLTACIHRLAVGYIMTILLLVAAIAAISPCLSGET